MDIAFRCRTFSKDGETNLHVETLRLSIEEFLRPGKSIFGLSKFLQAATNKKPCFARWMATHPNLKSGEPHAYISGGKLKRENAPNAWPIPTTSYPLKHILLFQFPQSSVSTLYDSPPIPVIQVQASKWKEGMS